jgi:broad specificity phosphatase PhoE
MHLHEVPEQDRPQALKAMFTRMSGITRDYAARRLVVPGAETWAEFKARASRALGLMVGSGKGKRVVAFSNCSYTSFLYSQGRCTLTSFNAVPHLYPNLWTVG